MGGLLSLCAIGLFVVLFCAVGLMTCTARSMDLVGLRQSNICDVILWLIVTFPSMEQIGVCSADTDQCLELEEEPDYYCRAASC